MISATAPAWVKRYYKDLIWRHPYSDKIFLTFDDGPTPGVTEEVLEILRRHQTKATFFCLGKNVAQYPYIYKRILDEGHAVGNHSYSHLNGWKVKTTEYINDVLKAEENILSNLFRPPYGRIKKSQIKSLLSGYKIIMWDVLSGDYHPKATPAICVSRVIKHTKPGSIVVFHDSLKAKENVLGSLDEIIVRLRSDGLDFSPLF
ncbi:MAG: polysaccharide deacetylase family protein [Flavobacteriales bacterium]